MRSSGLFDLQVNGFAGVDFNDADISSEAVDYALAAIRATGVTGCLPTLISASLPELGRRVRALDKAVSESTLGPQMVPGYHLEGPFLSAETGYRGCHPREVMADPSAEAVLELESGLTRPIVMVTLAPERPGAIPVVAELHARGKLVAVGHSEADFDALERAAAVGLSLSTHLGNGIPKLIPKLENTLLAQLAAPGLAASMIADGIHVPPDAFRALVGLKGLERTILVTDAVAAAAAPVGEYSLGGMPVTRRDDGTVRQSGSEYLAGAALCLDEAVRNTVAWGVADMPEAVRMASGQPLAKLAPAFAKHDIHFVSGELEWDEQGRPTLVRPGRLTIGGG